MKCSDCRFFDDLGCWYGDVCENRHLLEMKLEKERKYKLLRDEIKAYCIIKRKEAYNEAIDEVLDAIDLCMTQSECIEIIKELKAGGKNDE